MRAALRSACARHCRPSKERLIWSKRFVGNQFVSYMKILELQNEKKDLDAQVAALKAKCGEYV